MHSARAFFVAVLCILHTQSFKATSAEPGGEWVAGVARIDITPNYPIRLSGYGNRRTESEGIAQRLWAKALALGNTNKRPALLVTVDNCGVSAQITEEVASRLQKKRGILRERFTLVSSHTHGGPCLTGVIPNLFSQPIPPEHQATIDRYTRELIDKLEEVSLAALDDLKPSRLGWAQGQVHFAKNRRTKDGPVDPTLGLFRVTDPEGKIRALLVNYACHATTLQGEYNQVHADWPGHAQVFMERDHPGAVALVAIGCGADANPQPRGQPEHAQQHGEAVAAEVRRLLDQPLRPLRGALEGRLKRFQLPFQTLPTREQWEQRAKQDGIVGYHARVNLARLDRGETLPVTLDYSVAVWNFGDELAMVFLPGEVVVDYVLRLKKDFDPARLWVTAYANDVPCYIPSRRILTEGGYEAEGSLWYYDRPARLAPQTEELIHNAIHSLMPRTLARDPNRAEFPPALPPDQSLAAIHTIPGMNVELAAAEPDVIDPVAIDWGADGKLWVVEMSDFPTGLDGRWKPGGRVKALEDRDGDGRYERSTLFLDSVPFPTGIMAWNRGVLVCAAPDILYAEDTDGDGQADLRRPVYTGFATENYQARVNSLSLGLDNWIYGANGLIGGVIRQVSALPSLTSATGQIPSGEVNIRGRDFRFRLDTGFFEPASGLSQQGRVRDDWDNWFGCDNSTLLWHFPLADHYLRRNAHAPSPVTRVTPATEPDTNQLFPISRTLTRFNDPGHANRVTSACGLGFYRDDLFGPEFYGNAFVCEPVHNLVHRLKLRSDGVTFTAHRAERALEFLASTDNWFRPVQVRTGPDGALWIVDMYRFVVEHPRWITPDRLKELDLRAGDDKGRIYRVYPSGKTLRPIANLRSLSTPELVARLENPNGTERDRVHLELLHRRDTTAIEPLRKILSVSKSSAVRLQALSVLNGISQADRTTLNRALDDSDPTVRSGALRFAERLAPDPQLEKRVIERAADPDVRVRYQAALSLGEWKSEAVGLALGELAIRDAQNSWIQSAILSSAIPHANEILETALLSKDRQRLSMEFIGHLIATSLEEGDRSNAKQLSVAIFEKHFEPGEPAWNVGLAAALISGLERKALNEWVQPGPNALPPITEQLPRLNEQARKIAMDPSRDESSRLAAVRLLALTPEFGRRDASMLMELFTTSDSLALARTALDRLARVNDLDFSAQLIQPWPRYSPAQRQAVIDLLLRRARSTHVLLDAIDQGEVGPHELSPAHRQQLARHSAFADRVKSLTGTQAPRQSVLNRYQAVLQMKGDPAAGVPVFLQHCAACHHFRGNGTQVGPNLAALTDKSTPFMLMAILDPNAAVEDRYLNYTVETKDGRTLSGIIASESSNTLVLANATGRETLLRRDIAEIRASRLSLMPEGLEAAINPQQMADLIAYLQIP